MKGTNLKAAALTGMLALAACVPAAAPERPPSAPVAAPPAAVSQPSRASQALRLYYARVQADLLAQGLLRTDGGGPDTPFSADTLVRNFDRIAFYDEYTRGRGLQTASGTAGYLRRWRDPVRIAVEFGASVPPAQRAADSAQVARVAARLARATRHSITTASSGANFHVLVMGEDDSATTLERVKAIAPGINAASLAIFRNVPRAIHCLVVAFSSTGSDHDYKRAIALVRAEHPDLMRQSCFHEELAQGLGLANDSPQARPSIFNDDDEFALLTTHDEMLLKMLYDPRLSQGMSLDQARPILRVIASELTGETD